MKDKDAYELERYGRLCDDSYGFTCTTLCILYEQASYVSPEFHKALVKEMKWNLKNFRENTEITKMEETRTRIWEELNWIESTN